MLDLNNNQTKVGLGVVAALALLSTTYVFRNNIKSLFVKDETQTESEDSLEIKESTDDSDEKIVNTEE